VRGQSSGKNPTRGPDKLGGGTGKIETTKKPEARRFPCGHKRRTLKTDQKKGDII